MAAESRTRKYLETMAFQWGVGFSKHVSGAGNEYLAVVQYARKSGLMRGVRVQSVRRGRGRGLLEPEQPS